MMAHYLKEWSNENSTAIAIILFKDLKTHIEAEEKAQRVRALVFADNLGSILNTHIAAHNYL